MIDSVFFEVLNPDIANIRNHPQLKWKQTTNAQTGEVLYLTAAYYGLTFTINNDLSLKVSGSLYKPWNDSFGEGQQNDNNLSYKNLCEVIDDLIETFELNPFECILRNIGFGINVSPEFSGTTVLNSVIYSNGTPIGAGIRDGGRYRNCLSPDYFTELFCKDTLLGFPEHLLRFEHRTLRRGDLKKTGIQNLADVLDFEKITSLGAILIRDFDDLLFSDNSIDETKLTPSERQILIKGQTPYFWSSYKQTNPNSYYKTRARFRKIVNKYGKQPLHETVRTLISQKLDEYVNIDPKACWF